MEEHRAENVNYSGWIQRAQCGDLQAFDRIVALFQDMAVGYAYTLIHDLHWAEDAAQEAFLQAFLDLPTLKDPRAFPGWFRKIVFKQCDRLSRRKRVLAVSLEAAEETVSSAPGPDQVLETAERNASLWAELDRLPEKERDVLVLFHFGGYSQTEIGCFLELPVTTIKKRLQAARQHLRDRRMTMVQDELSQHAPSQNPRFERQVQAALRDFHAPNPEHDVKKMPWSRLYAELEEQASTQADQPVSDLNLALFNALLSETRTMHPDDPVLQAIPEAPGQESVEAMLVSVGQGNHATCRSPVLKYAPMRRKAVHLHEDLARIAQRDPARLTPPNAVTIFNALLRAVKQRFPENATFQTLSEAQTQQNIAVLEEAAALLREAMEAYETHMTEAERDQPW